MTTTYYCDTVSDFVFKKSQHLGWWVFENLKVLNSFKS
jgi:hypothetical protein